MVGSVLLHQPTVNTPSFGRNWFTTGKKQQGPQTPQEQAELLLTEALGLEHNIMDLRIEPRIASVRAHANLLEKRAGRAGYDRAATLRERARWFRQHGEQVIRPEGERQVVGIFRNYGGHAKVLAPDWFAEKGPLVRRFLDRCAQYPVRGDEESRGAIFEIWDALFPARAAKKPRVEPHAFTEADLLPSKGRPPTSMLPKYAAQVQQTLGRA